MIQDQIATAEQQWLGRTYDYCRACFADVFLPSHDETHHLRTWHFARALLPLAHEHLFPFTADETVGLLLASLLHDSGMSQTTAPDHGAAGRRLAENFFASLPHPPALAEEILTAIEKHDDKSYRQHLSTAAPAGRILTLLSAADDLDAFGYTGVFRYYEIYSLRGITPEAMAGRIVTNLRSRYENMQPLLALAGDLQQHHRRRYLITRNFFSDLAGNKKQEALTVIRYLENLRQQKVKPSATMLSANGRGSREPCLKKFLSGWMNELHL